MIKYSGKDKFKKKVAEILNNGGLGTKPKWEDVQDKPDTFPPSEHNHDDRYFTEDEITELMKGKADSDHNHDERYNTKDELASLLDGKLSTTLKGTVGGLAELDENGKVPASQLPSYVDDVIEGYYYENYFYEDAEHTLMIVGEAGKIYIDLVTNKTYRWSGSIFTVISETLALGETSSTAYRGDRGKIAYEHSQSAHAPADAQKNVQSDWNATSGDAYIKNKPTEFPPSTHTHKSLTLDNGMVIYFYEDDGYITANSSKQYGSGIVLEMLKAYYADFAGSVDWSNVSNKPGSYPPSTHTHTKSQITDFPSSLPASGGTASGLYDYNNSKRVIQLGFEGAGLTTSNLNYIAGYTDSGTKIKDVSKDVLKSWLGTMPPSSHSHITYGTNTNGAYYKFDDGTLICTKKITFTGINCNSTWGALYETATTYSFGNYAYKFTDTPNVTVNQESGTTLIPEAFNNRNNTSIGDTWFFRPTAVNNVRCTYSIIAIGRWK